MTAKLYVPRCLRTGAHTLSAGGICRHCGERPDVSRLPTGALPRITLPPRRQQNTERLPWTLPDLRLWLRALPWLAILGAMVLGTIAWVFSVDMLRRTHRGIQRVPAIPLIFWCGAVALALAVLSFAGCVPYSKLPPGTVVPPWYAVDPPQQLHRKDLHWIVCFEDSCLFLDPVVMPTMIVCYAKSTAPDCARQRT